MDKEQWAAWHRIMDQAAEDDRLLEEEWVRKRQAREQADKKAMEILASAKVEQVDKKAAKELMPIRRETKLEKERTVANQLKERLVSWSELRRTKVSDEEYEGYLLDIRALENKIEELDIKLGLLNKTRLRDWNNLSLEERVKAFRIEKNKDKKKKAGRAIVELYWKRRINSVLVGTECALTERFAD